MDTLSLIITAATSAGAGAVLTAIVNRRNAVTLDGQKIREELHQWALADRQAFERERELNERLRTRIAELETELALQKTAGA